MRKNSRKISLAILALTAVSLGCVATGNLALRTAAAEINTLDTFRLENVSVRLKLPGEDVNGGFRFESLISQEKYDSFENVTEVGTLFTITDMPEDSFVMGASNVAKIVLEGTVGEENRRGGEKITDDEGKDVISYRAFINDIPDTAFDTDVMARSYVVADGATYYTNVVTQSVGDVARDAYYDVQEESNEDYTETVQDGWYSPFTLAQREEISKYITTTEKTYAPQYVLVEEGNATLDLTKLSVEENDVVGVMVDDKFTEWSVDGSTLTYATTVGEKTLTVATTDGVYDVALVQADNVITTWAEYNTWAIVAGGGYNSYEYTVLANDITAPSGYLYTNGGQFQKTFNGLGHTIDNFNCGHGIVQRLLPGGTWKNVNYTNITVNDQGLFGYLAGGTFENITVSGKLTYNRILAYSMNSSATKIVNCDFMFTESAKENVYLATGEMHYYTVTLENTTITSVADVNDTTCACCGKEAKYVLNNCTYVRIMDTNYYAKVSGGNATFALSQMGENAPTTVSEVKVNGVEVQATVANGVLSYPATNVGATALSIKSDKGAYIMNIVHADKVITTWAEYNTWAIVAGGGYNSYEYTVLASDITAPSGALYTNGGHFQKTFDGLGHTIDGFTCGHGIVQRLLTGATWKNVNYTNITINDQGVFGYLAGGTFENVNISGKLTSDRILTYGMNNSNTKIVNCTFNLTKADNATVDLAKGEIHYYYITLVNSTVNYSGTVNYETCPCGSCANSKPSRITLNNSTVNSNYNA